MAYRGMFSSMLYGLVVIFILALSFSLIVSLLLTFSSLTESSFTWIILGVSFLTLFIGGLVSGAKSKQKGWITGAGTAFLFTLVTFLVQYLGYNIGFSTEQYLYHGGYLLCAAIGGIIGVNISGD